MTAARCYPEPMKAGAAVSGEETELIRRAQAGNGEAFDALVRRHLPRAYAVAFRVTGNRQDAEDVVQDGFVAAWRGMDRFELGRPFGPWLYRIIANAGVSLLRKEGRRRGEVLDEAARSRGGTPLGDTLRSEVRDRFTQTLALLPERQRLAIQWHDVDGFSAEEIGQTLRVPSGTVRWYIHQARQALRQTLAPLRGPVEDTHDPP